MAICRQAMPFYILFIIPLSIGPIREIAEDSCKFHVGIVEPLSTIWGIAKGEVPPNYKTNSIGFPLKYIANVLVMAYSNITFPSWTHFNLAFRPG